MIWNHLMCDSCWNRRNPEREAHRIIQYEMKRCCFCASLTMSGINVRVDPVSTKMVCQSWHKEREEREA